MTVRESRVVDAAGMTAHSGEEHSLSLCQPYTPHLAAPPTEEERKQVRYFLEIAEAKRNGFLNRAIRAIDEKRNEKKRKAETYNPFTDVPQYGMKGHTAKVPKFSDFPFSNSPCARSHFAMR